MIFRYLMWFMLLIICTLYIALKVVKATSYKSGAVGSAQEQLMQVNYKMNQYITQQELVALR